jgi:diguanylate cyclase (GGDEF)-like protein
VAGERLGFAIASPREKLLFWTVLVLAFGRFLAINAAVSRLRARLHQKNRELEGVSVKLADLAIRDELTGLRNRREFMKLLAEEAERARRSGDGFSVALVDADGFKEVNDRFGHLAGDVVLQRLAALLAGTVRTGDCLSRYGGEEFAVLLSGTTAEAGAAILERMRDAVERHDWDQLAPGLRLTMSAGVAAGQPGEAVERTLSRADQALYAAKHAGRNCVQASAARQGAAPHG